MEYKRFSTVKKEPHPTFTAPPPPPIVQSVSEIEIGKEDVTFLAAPIKRSKRYGAVFRVFMMCAALGVLALPFTAVGKKSLDTACSLLTADDATAKARISEWFGHLTAQNLPSESRSSEKETLLRSGLSSSYTALPSDFIPAAAPLPPEFRSESADSDADASVSNSAQNFSAARAVSNETAYDVDLSALSDTPYPIPYLSGNGEDAVNVFGETAPSVLILHTHGTECYADASDASHYRTDNPSENVVSVGKVLAEALRAQGIETIHCEEMFDKDSFIRAYKNSYAAAAEYLKQYPSIRYVIDLHRDAVPSDGGYADLKTTLCGEECAKLMLVIGTDEAGAVHPNWKNNLRVAAEIQQNAEKEYPSLMRSINLRKASFNQQLSDGYFILEVGSCGGTAEEARAGMKYFAKAFADTIKGQTVGG